jgi:hypothetical protein
MSLVALESFGSEAPRIRKPSDVTLPPDPQDRIENAKKAFEVLSREVLDYEGPDFDPVTGRISIGRDVEGNRTHWQLLDADGHPCHGVVMGVGESGKSSVLDIIIVGAAASGLFVPWMADGGGRHHIRNTWRSRLDWIAPDLEEFKLMLRAAAEIVAARREKADFQRVCRETPAILIAVDDAHLAFAESPETVQCAERIVKDGPPAGVAMVVVVPDGNIARFGGSNVIRSLIGKANRAVFGQIDGLQLLEDLG